MSQKRGRPKVYSDVERKERRTLSRKKWYSKSKNKISEYNKQYYQKRKEKEIQAYLAERQHSQPRRGGSKKRSHKH